MSDLAQALGELLADLGAADVSTPIRLGGGSSQENWAFDAELDTPQGRMVRPLLMRREPASGVVDTDRGTEYALLRALGQTDLPVARVYALDDGTRLGRPAMVVDRLAGRAHRGVLRANDPLQLGESARLTLAASLPDLLASVHRLDRAAFALDSILPDPGADPAQHELQRWVAELDAVELEPQPALRATIAWLRRHAPEPPPRITLVHGDFRPANVLVDNDRVTALLDWELAHLGDPHDDLGWYTCTLYRREHFIAGQWDLRDFLQRWSAASGIQVDNARLHFWQVMSIFRLAVIALTAVKAFCQKATDRPAAPADVVIKAALRETGMLETSRTAEPSQ
jgi:aminoglycoside phosphotransferase (APT) family kinase protein